MIRLSVLLTVLQGGVFAQRLLRLPFQQPLPQLTRQLSQPPALFNPNSPRLSPEFSPQYTPDFSAQGADFAPQAASLASYFSAQPLPSATPSRDPRTPQSFRAPESGSTQYEGVGISRGGNVGRQRAMSVGSAGERSEDFRGLVVRRPSRQIRERRRGRPSEDIAGIEGLLAMCESLKDAQVTDVVSGTSACEDHAAQLLFHPFFYWAQCRQVVLPYYLENGAASITCRAHSRNWRENSHTWARSIQSLQCDQQDTGLQSLHGLLDDIYDRFLTVSEADGWRLVQEYDGRDISSHSSPMLEKACYYAYHYAPSTSSMSIPLYWTTFGRSMLQTDIPGLQQMECNWQRDRFGNRAPEMGCADFMQLLAAGGTINNREVDDYNYDYLRMDPVTVVRQLKGYDIREEAFPWATDQESIVRFSLNVVAEARGYVFGCLARTLLNPARALASGIKATGLHAPSTRSSAAQYKQLDNIVVYTHAYLAFREVLPLITNCSQGLEGPEDIPMMQKMAPGVFYGEEAPAQGSFGSTRCKAINEGWEEMERAGLRRDRAFFKLYAVENLVDEARISRCRPYQFAD